MKDPLKISKRLVPSRPQVPRAGFWIVLWSMVFTLGVWAEPAERAPRISGPAASPLGRGFGHEHLSRMSEPPTAAEMSAAETGLTNKALEKTATSEMPVVAPTRSTFLATWNAVPGAVDYQLEVTTDRSFAREITRYPDPDAGKVNFRMVSELQPATTYYYRVRSVDAQGQTTYSEAMSATTSSSAGLTIVPIYDPSVENSSISPQIKATVSKAIGVYQALFKDPVTVKILFRYSTVRPDNTPIPLGTVSESLSYLYSLPWSEVINALKGDASSESDTTAIASLPAAVLSPNITINSANGRVIGLNTPAQPYSSDVANGQPLDGVVNFYSAAPLQFSRPIASGKYDALGACEHEMDEVLGLGSHLRSDTSEPDLRPQDLYSWSAPGARNTTRAGTRYFSIDRGVTRVVDFNQQLEGDAGDWASGHCPALFPRVQDAFLCEDDIADVTRSSPESLNLDVIGYDLAPVTPAPALANISTRLFVQGGDGALIGGFIVTGSAPKNVLVRAIGPSLPLTNALPNPTLELHSGDGSLIASNDNWQSSQRAQILATGLAPTNSLESAIFATLAPGNYTAVVRSTSSAVGIALVEAYDLEEAGDSTFGNISTRGSVGVGDKVLIGGFIISGGDPTRVLVRALGPSLPVTGPLADPTLELHNSNGTIIATNDDWRSNQQTAITATGLAPPLPQESALISTLQPGPYTVIVQGKEGATGVALMEIYHLTN